MNLADIDQLNECADFLYAAGVIVTPVKFAEASELWGAIQNLSQISERLKLGPAWKEFCRQNKILYYRLASGICSPASVIGDMRGVLASSYMDIRHSVNGVDLEAQQAVEKIVRIDTGLWATLAKQKSSPIYKIINDRINEAIRRSQKKAVFILRDNRFKEQTIDLLSGFRGTINIEVRKSNELRNYPKVDRVFYVGSMKGLRWYDEEFLLRAPVTDEFEFIELSHSGKIQTSSLDIFALESGRRFLLNEGPENESIESISSRPEIYLADAEFEEVEDVDSDVLDTEPNSLRAIDAFRAILGGGYRAHFSAESNVFVVHCRAQGAAFTCTSIERKDVLDLEPGDLVVLTTEGSGDLIAPYADRIIGSMAKTYRELQIAWKKDLSKLIVDIGTARVIENLKVKSGFAISATNLRQWLGQTVHGPGKERPLLFNAVLELLQRGDRIHIHQHALDQIRDGSIKAGHQLQSELRRKLLGLNMSTVLADGFMHFRMEANGPAKTVFELKKLDTSARSVSPHSINRVFKLKHESEEA